MVDSIKKEKKVFVCKTSLDTQKVGAILANTLKGGEVITSKARMGVGKTCLAQGIAKGLGVKRIVNSPTFNMIKVYQGDIFTFYHVDAYRLENALENKDIGLHDFLNTPDSITYIEWPEYITEDLKNIKDVIRITIELLEDNSRKVTIEYGE